MFGTQKRGTKGFNVKYRVSVGNPLRLFATIMQVIREKYKNFKEITFSTTEPDRGKEAVYERIARAVAREHGRTMFVSRTGAGGTVWHMSK